MVHLTTLIIIIYWKIVNLLYLSYRKLFLEFRNDHWMTKRVKSGLYPIVPFSKYQTISAFCNLPLIQQCGLVRFHGILNIDCNIIVTIKLNKSRPDGIVLYLIYYFTLFSWFSRFLLFYWVCDRILEVRIIFLIFALDIPQSLLGDHLASFERLKLSYSSRITLWNRP